MKSIKATVNAVFDDLTNEWAVAVLTNDFGKSSYEEFTLPASVADDEIIPFAVGKHYGFEVGCDQREDWD